MRIHSQQSAHQRDRLNQQHGNICIKLYKYVSMGRSSGYIRRMFETIRALHMSRLPYGGRWRICGHGFGCCQVMWTHTQVIYIYIYIYVQYIYIYMWMYIYIYIYSIYDHCKSYDSFWLYTSYIAIMTKSPWFSQAQAHPRSSRGLGWPEPSAAGCSPRIAPADQTQCRKVWNQEMKIVCSIA